ncbi:MAG TPA: hypothetical protein VEA15_09215 [Caulobacteraceae bacterium]|nr:hypothetical protein [Caulobacteraceae bacterium]
MALYPEAFGPYDPQDDPLFAAKLIVAVMVADGHSAMLAALIDGTSEFETIEGEPGWALERRAADFRAWVPPEVIASGRPEIFVGRATLAAFLEAALSEARARRH